jgi:hybrid cluster-associated redox disulfide protein
MKKVEITKDMTLAEVLNYRKNAKEILMGFGMHCFSCPVSQMETVEEAAEVHDCDLQLLIEKLNEAD